FGSLFLTARTAGLIGAGHVIGMLALPVLVPGYDMTTIVQGPVSFSLMMTLTVLAFGWYRERLESQRQARMAESETRYRIVSELISDYAYSYTVGAKGDLHEDWITGSFSRVTGYDWEELQHYELFHPDYVNLAHEDVKRVLAGDSITREYKIVTKDRHER